MQAFASPQVGRIPQVSRIPAPHPPPGHQEQSSCLQSVRAEDKEVKKDSRPWKLGGSKSRCY